MKIYLSLLVRLRESSNGKTTCVFRGEHKSTKLVKKKKKKKRGRRIFLVVGTSVSGITTCEMFRKYRSCNINQLGHLLIHRKIRVSWWY